MADDGAPAAAVMTRPRQADAESVAAVLCEHITSPVLFDSAVDIASDKKAWRKISKRNEGLFCALHRLAPTLSFAPVTLKAALADCAEKNRDSWNFVTADLQKWAADVAPTLHAVLRKLGKELRRQRPPRWIAKMFALSNGVPEQEDEEEEAGIEGGDAALEWEVGWHPQQEMAFRVPDGGGVPEFTVDLRVPEGSGDLDPMVAHWPDGFSHEVAALQVGLWKEKQATKLHRGAHARWSAEVDGKDITVKVGALSTAGGPHKAIMVVAGKKETQVCQILCSGLDDPEKFAQTLAAAYAAGEIEGVTHTDLATDRPLLRDERDRRLRALGVASAQLLMMLLLFGKKIRKCKKCRKCKQKSKGMKIT